MDQDLRLYLMQALDLVDHEVDEEDEVGVPDENSVAASVIWEFALKTRNGQKLDLQICQDEITKFFAGLGINIEIDETTSMIKSTGCVFTLIGKRRAIAKFISLNLQILDNQIYVTALPQ